jgi:CII-binding regulator of phage lambda lysogenization HflD
MLTFSHIAHQRHLMIVEKDYVMRSTVQQFAAFVARVFALKAQKKCDEALEILASGTPAWLGIELNTLLSIDAQSAAELLGSDEKVLMLAQLLEARSEVFESVGDDIHSWQSQLTAYELFAEVLMRTPASQPAREGLGRLSAMGALELLPARYRHVFKMIAGAD